MKKAIALLLALMLVFTLTACGDKEKTGGEAFDGNETVTLVMPEFFFTEETEEEIIAAAKEEGFQTAKLNEDGTVTVTITKANQNKMIGEYEEEIERSISEMLQNKAET
ncbi:MAG: hypothetical protein K5855_06870, partial [Oscillospiraceae bacterium]|nr:hypothetical protein [Oscillospiraceae bacterium]